MSQFIGDEKTYYNRLRWKPMSSDQMMSFQTALEKLGYLFEGHYTGPAFAINDRSERKEFRVANSHWKHGVGGNPGYVLTVIFNPDDNAMLVGFGDLYWLSTDQRVQLMDDLRDATNGSVPERLFSEVDSSKKAIWEQQGEWAVKIK